MAFGHRRIQKLMALAKSTLNGKVMAHAPLDTWVDPSGRVALLGDAAHPMLVRNSSVSVPWFVGLSNFIYAALSCAGRCHGRK